jgi:hypothetical protein
VVPAFVDKAPCVVGVGSACGAQHLSHSIAKSVGISARSRDCGGLPGNRLCGWRNHALCQLGEMFRQLLRLTADIGNRGHLPKGPFGHRTNGKEAAGDRAGAVEERTTGSHVEAEPQRIGPYHTIRQEAANQRFPDTVVIRSRAGTIDHARDCHGLARIHAARTVQHVEPRFSDVIRTHAPRDNTKLAAVARGIDAVRHQPWGLTESGSLGAVLLAAPFVAFKVLLFLLVLVAIESSLSKLRLFRIAEFTSGAFVIAVVAMISRLFTT